MNIKFTAVTRNGLCGRSRLKDSPGGSRAELRGDLSVQGAWKDLGETAVGTDWRVCLLGSVTQSVPAAHCFQSSAGPALDELDM